MHVEKERQERKLELKLSLFRSFTILQLELDMGQLISSKPGKEYKAIYCHPAYLTYMQSASCEMPGWMSPMLESRLLGEVSTTSDM